MLTANGTKQPSEKHIQYVSIIWVINIWYAFKISFNVSFDFIYCHCLLFTIHFPSILFMLPLFLFLLVNFNYTPWISVICPPSTYNTFSVSILTRYTSVLSVCYFLKSDYNFKIKKNVFFFNILYTFLFALLLWFHSIRIYVVYEYVYCLHYSTYTRKLVQNKKWKHNHLPWWN